MAIDLKQIDQMTEDERRVHLPFGLNDEIYPCHSFSSKSIFGVAHTGELKGIKNPVIQRVVVDKNGNEIILNDY